MKPISPTGSFTGGYAFLEHLARILPVPAQRITARLFCEAVFWGAPSLRRTLLHNLAIARPDQTPRHRFALAHRILINYGTYLRDLLAVMTAPSLPPAEQYFDELGNLDAIEAALASENGALLVTPHLGHWELGMLPLAAWRGRLAAVTAPIASPVMRARMEDFRARNGVELVTLEKPEEYLFILKRLLSERKLVTLLVDRYVGGHGMRIPFFGRDVLLPCGYLYLARMFEAPVVPVFVLRNPRGLYTCIADTPIRVARTDDREADIHNALAQVVTVMERQILAHPDQWYCFAPLNENHQHLRTAHLADTPHAM